MTNSVDTRPQNGALVDVVLAVATGETLQARAGVVADSVDARSSVLARIFGALVYVLEAHGSGKSDWAAALVTVDQVETLLAV